jgi:hypothetical protein
MQRNGQKRDKQFRWEKTTGKKVVFSQLFGQKVLDWVFELPLLRNPQKRHKQISKIKLKKKRKVPTPFSGHLPDIRRFQFLFLWRPLGPSSPCLQIQRVAHNYEPKGGRKKKSDVSKYLFWRLREILRDFCSLFSRVFELELL